MKTGSTAAGLLSPGWTQPGAEVSKTVLLKSMLMTDPRKAPLSILSSTMKDKEKSFSFEGLNFI